MLIKKNSMQYLIIAVFTLLALSCAESESSKSNADIRDYLAIQFNNGDNWSIIDANGEVVVDGEYISDNEYLNKHREMSLIYDGGIFWVKANGKYCLYSLKSPKKPVVGDEYDEVTDFVDGYAFVKKTGEPIVMIDSKGCIVKTLPRDVTRVHSFSEGMAEFSKYSQEYGKSCIGYLDKRGETVIEPQYQYSSSFKEGLAWVKKEAGNNGNFQVIDKKGNALFELKGEGYWLNSLNYFQEGKLSAEKDGTLVFIDEKGKERLVPHRASSDAHFCDGYAALLCGDLESSYVIDANDETIIRKGKYKDIYNLGNGFFAAKKNDRFGIIDKEDNTIVDFVYVYAADFRLGNNFLMQKDDMHWVLVNPKGKEINNVRFADMAGYSHGFVTFIDVKGILSEFLKPITAEGYSTIKGGKTAADIGPISGAKLEGYSSRIPGKSFKAHGYDVSVTYYFKIFATKEKTRIEEVNDGWFVQQREVNDGWCWNENAELNFINQEIEIDYFSHRDFILTTLKKMLMERGFRLDQDEYSEMIFYAPDGNRLAIFYSDDEFDGYSKIQARWISTKNN